MRPDGAASPPIVRLLGAFVGVALGTAARSLDRIAARIIAR